MEPIIVESIDFRAQANAKQNYTEEYDLVKSETPTAIFRRGQNFDFTITCNRPFNPKSDIVRVSFSLGPTPNTSKGTKIILPVLPMQKALPPSNRWGLLLTETKENEMSFKAHIPPLAPIGIWFCSVQTNISGDKDKRGDYSSKEELYIIFNPWCKDDHVYLDDIKERNEYVLNETGKIWMGTFKEPKSKRWVYGQFDKVVLPATMFLLEKSKVPHANRGSAVLIARAISALINSKDDDGLVEGKWEDDCADGKSPFEWSGSTSIMEEYMKSGGVPVKYGQCWVFAAVGVTIFRTLGIPCRCVTNYISAHDTNNSLTVDKYFDVFGNVIESGPQGDCTDSCWNFHVWTDVWMTRPDLPPGNDGWQVVDGTPQELSNNETYCCGPTSVNAIKKGDVGLLYDTAFVFSEVNADVCNFQEDEESEWGFTRLSINRYHVGRKLLTKKVDKNDEQADTDMQDITGEYKSPEGSQEERSAIQSAIRAVPRAQEHYNIPSKSKEDVFFDLKDIETVPLGENFEVEVHIRNTSSDETRNVTVNMNASSVYYTGATAHRLKSAQGTFNIKAGGKEILKLLVKPDDYLDKLTGHGLVKIYAIANVKETKQTWCEEDDFTFTKPTLTVDVKDNVRVGEESALILRFKNPLGVALTDCKYSVEGAGVLKPKSQLYQDVKPNEDVAITELFAAQLQGTRTIVATFTCKQIEGVGGSATITIE